MRTDTLQGIIIVRGSTGADSKNGKYIRIKVSTPAKPKARKNSSRKKTTSRKSSN